LIQSLHLEKVNVLRRLRSTCRSNSGTSRTPCTAAEPCLLVALVAGRSLSITISDSRDGLDVEHRLNIRLTQSIRSSVSSFLRSTGEHSFTSVRCAKINTIATGAIATRIAKASSGRWTNCARSRIPWIKGLGRGDQIFEADLHGNLLLLAIITNGSSSCSSPRRMRRTPRVRRRGEREVALRSERLPLIAAIDSGR